MIPRKTEKENPGILVLRSKSKAGSSADVAELSSQSESVPLPDMWSDVVRVGPAATLNSANSIGGSQSVRTTCKYPINDGEFELSSAGKRRIKRSKIRKQEAVPGTAGRFKSLRGEPPNMMYTFTEFTRMHRWMI